MQITRQQEIALWRLLANSLGLKYEESGVYIGKCPFCNLENVFGIDTLYSYAGCIRCGEEAHSLYYCLRRLRDLMPVPDLG